MQTNTYNSRNELTGITKGETTSTYSYNAEGKRTTKQVGTEITKFVYDGKDIILELDNNNNEIAKNVYGLALLTRKTDEQKGYYLYNGHGDVEKKYMLIH